MNDERDPSEPEVRGPTLDYHRAKQNTGGRSTANRDTFDFGLGLFGSFIAAIFAVAALANPAPLAMAMLMAPCLAWVGFIAHAGFKSGRYGMMVGAATMVGLFVLLVGLLVLGM